MGDLRNKKEKNQNIQVFVRVRPISSREREIKSYSVVETHGTRDIFVKHPPENKVTKKFTYDKVFGPASKQLDVYTSVVSPLIEEVLSGYSCTVFAYGQTGTGKTFTMAGENINGCGVSWQDDPMAGIIPRAVTQLFDELRVSALEYSIRVSYLELYNEELFDLLSPIDDNSKIRMYEDPTKKGSVIVHGLEEIPVQNKLEVYKIMERGQEKRKTAATLMNAQSSRSHTIFSILVHIKESSMEGEELLKAGKLNLVDLAGSENITKAGNDKKERARETVNINQSLLTLGRVITSLVERGPHIPYRESKLTRLLQDSLGGRTKTSIIATISPGHKDLDETLSTLEYAFRAKNIMNKPEINQRLAKTVVLKEYTAEIDRLRKDLAAHRDKDGVHLANETYIEMTLKIEDQNKEIADKIMQIRAFKDEIEKQQDLYATVFSTLKDREMHLEKTTEALTTTRNTLNNTKQKLKHTMVVCDEKTHIIKKQMDTEAKLGSQVHELISVAELTTNDVCKLQDSLDLRRNVDEKIQTTAELFRSNVSSNMSVVCEELANFLASQTSHSQDIMAKLIKCDSEQADYKNKMLEIIEAANVEQVNVLTSNKDTLDSLQDDLNLCSEKDLEDHLKYVKVENEKLSDSRSNVLGTLVEQMMSMFDKQRTSLSRYHQLISNQAAENLQIVQEFSSIQKVKLEQLGLQFNKQLDDQKCILENFSKLQEEVLQMKEKNKMETKKKIDRIFKELTSLSNGYDKETECTESAFRVMKGHVDSLEQANVKMNDTITCNIRSGILEHEGHVEKMSSRNDLFINDVEKSATECDGTNIGECFIQFNSELNCVFDNVEEAFTETDNKRKKSHSNIVKRVREGVESRKESLDSGITALVKAKRDQIESVTQQHQSLDAAISEQKKLHEDGLQSLNVFHNETSSELLNLDQTVEKYLSEDLTLYAPTGQTPARKDYQFPKDIVATSPHNKIIKRFRQQMQACKENQINVQNSSEGSSDDVELVDGTSTAPQLPLTTIDLNSTFPTMTNPEPHHSLFKAASEINILHVPTEVREKENGFRGCARHEDNNIKSALPVLQRLGSKIDMANNKK